MITWPAMVRYQTEAAPGGLGFVHDLLSTASAGKPRRPDLLTDQASAQGWLDTAMASWAAVTGQHPKGVTLSQRDTVELRRFRDTLRRQIGHPADFGEEPDSGARTQRLPQLAVTLRPDASGQIQAESRGSAWRAVAALALIEIYRAQVDGVWPRLKICRNERCEGAFYDRSRNNSGVWHDVRVCGNQANLRAYRARHRPGGPGGRS